MKIIEYSLTYYVAVFQFKLNRANLNGKKVKQKGLTSDSKQTIADVSNDFKVVIFWLELNFNIDFFL